MPRLREGTGSDPRPGRGTYRPAEPRGERTDAAELGAAAAGRRARPSLAPRGTCTVDTRRSESPRPLGEEGPWSS